MFATFQILASGSLTKKYLTFSLHNLHIAFPQMAKKTKCNITGLWNPIEMALVAVRLKKLKTPPRMLLTCVPLK